MPHGATNRQAIMNRALRILVWVVAAEVIAAGVAIGWKLSRPAAPRVNLARMPVSTAADIERLQRAVWNDRQPAWFELGEAYLAFGYFAEAELCLRRSAELAPRQTAALFAHACSLDRLGRLPESSSRFAAAAALETGEKQGNCRYHIGRNHLRAEQLNEALEMFESAGNYPPAVHERARLMVRQGQAKSALALVEDLRARYPLDVKVEMLAARTYRELQNPAETAVALLKSERSQSNLRVPNSADYLHSIRTRYGLTGRLNGASQLLDQKDLQAAARQFQSVVDSNPPEFLESVYLTGVRLHLGCNQISEAADLLVSFRKRLAPSAVAWRILGNLFASRGAIAEARQAWNAANALVPDAPIFQALSEFSAREGDEARARFEIGQARLHDGIGLFRSNRLNEAVAALQAAAELLPDDSLPWFYLGETRRALLEPEAAQADYRKAVEINPDEGRALERLALPAK